MSVINDMLRDLEQRKAPDRSELDTSSSNGSLIDTQSSNTNKYLISLIVLLLIVGVGVSILLLRDLEIKITPLSNSSITSTTIANQETVDKPPLMNDGSTQMKIVPVTSSSTEVQVVKHEVIPKTSEKKKTDVVTLEPKNSVPKHKSTTQITQMMAVQKYNVDEKPSNTRPISMANTTTAAAKPKALLIATVAKPMVRRKPAISPQKRDQNMAELSRKLFNADEPRKAYRLLYEFVASHIVDLESRTVLISYLLQDERIAEAGDVLVTTDVDQSPALRQLKARWYVAQDEHNLALHILRKNLPELDSYPEYYALLAAYYQRFGFSAKAAETYAGLLEYDNESSNWWAGLAIALDSSKQYKQAVNAYKQALEMPDLSPGLFEYIENRLNLLTVAASRKVPVRE